VGSFYDLQFLIPDYCLLILSTAYEFASFVNILGEQHIQNTTTYYYLKIISESINDKMVRHLHEEHARENRIVFMFLCVCATYDYDDDIDSILMEVE
jgi:hypothetical protein